ncbi:MAG: UPF0280 family protein [Beijerinckiaceae bacterium]
MAAGASRAGMKTRAQIAFLPDGRLHLQDGPIDLLIRAEGKPAAQHQAYDAAITRFHGLLDELCRELPLIRSQARPSDNHLESHVARAMNRACAPFLCYGFITPMAAVAGAVADEIMRVMIQAAPLTRAFVNNGGDIALHLAPDESFMVGIVASLAQARIDGTVQIHARDPVRGIATSGCGGRSFSLGIADAVTVLAKSAARADAAATVIANAVNLPDHPAVLRRRACDLYPDSDLGERHVTVAVGALHPDEIAAALDAGEAVAQALLGAGNIVAACLHLRGESRVVHHEAMTIDGPSGDHASRCITDAPMPNRNGSLPSPMRVASAVI